MKKMKTLDLSSLEILHIYKVCISNHKNLWKEYLNYCIHVLYIFIQVLSRNSSSSNVIKEYIKRLYAYSSILLQFSCCYDNFQAFHFNERDVVCIQRLGFLERKKSILFWWGPHVLLSACCKFLSFSWIFPHWLLRVLQ